MEAFFVVVMAALVLSVAVVALAALRRVTAPAASGEGDA
jgi:hypothetical protein